MVVGSFAEHGAALVTFMGISVLRFAPLLVKLLHEVGFCFPPQLFGGLFPFVQKFGLKQATGVHLGHKLVHLVVIGDRDLMVFALYLAPVQFVHEGGDVRFGGVTPRSN